MRFVIRGYTDPFAFPVIFDEIADRLLSLGVTNISSINLYLKAFSGRQELKPFEESGAPAEMIQMWSPADPEIAAQRQALPKVYIVGPTDVSRVKLCARFFGSVGFSRKDISHFLQLSEDCLGNSATGPLKCEFGCEVREPVTTFTLMIEAALELFQWREMIDWFRSIHLHSKLEGVTPREQLKFGGTIAAEEIAKALDLHSKRARFGEPLPNLHTGYYDVFPDGDQSL